MNDGIIQLSHEQMKAKAAEILSNGQAIDDLLKRIDSKMVLSIAGGDIWNSMASRQFYDIFKAEAANFPKFLEKLTDYANFVNATVEKNIRDDQANASAVDATLNS